jgi:hypothetical protein
MVMSKYSPEDRARIFAEAHAALAAAEATLNAPRPEVAWPPPSEDRVQRVARERATAQIAERREWSLTEYEAQKLEARMVERIGAGLGEQKDFFLQLLAELTAHLQRESAERIERLTAELEQVRADLTIARFNNGTKSEPSGGEIVDLPAFPLKRKTA